MSDINIIMEMVFNRFLLKRVHTGILKARRMKTFCWQLVNVYL